MSYLVIGAKAACGTGAGAFASYLRRWPLDEAGYGSSLRRPHYDRLLRVHRWPLQPYNQSGCVQAVPEG